MNIDIIRTQMMLLGISQQQLAEQLSVNRTTIHRWLNGDVSRINDIELEKKLAHILKLSVSALKEDSRHLVKPILGNVKAGYDLFIEQDILGYEEVSELESQKGDYYLQVSGDSMIGDGIFEGDLVYVKQTGDVPNHAIAVVLVGDEVTIKHVEHKDEFLILSASNPKVSTRTFNHNEIEVLPVKVLGRVIGSKRSFL